MSNYFLLVIMTVLGAFGALFLKKASSDIENTMQIITKKELYIGGILYVSSAILNIIVLKEIDYVVVLPATSITYIWTLAISWKYLGEKLTFKKLGGIAFIILGCFVLVI